MVGWTDTQTLTYFGRRRRVSMNSKCSTVGIDGSNRRLTNLKIETTIHLSCVFHSVGPIHALKFVGVKPFLCLTKGPRPYSTSPPKSSPVKNTWTNYDPRQDPHPPQSPGPRREDGGTRKDPPSVPQLHTGSRPVPLWSLDRVPDPQSVAVRLFC